jgi:hypothetical protein
MTHQQVIENFVKEGQRGTGFSVKATKDMLYSPIPARSWPDHRPADRLPLAVRLSDDSLLVNGASLRLSISRRHQYRAGDRKGQVFARGVLAHTENEHNDLDLGAIRWYLIVHNVAGAAYTLTGKGTAQFD